MRDPQTLIRLTEQLDAIKARRKSGTLITDPIRLSENRHAKACQPRAKMLIDDYDFDAVTAWQIALDDQRFYEFQRFATIKGAELASPSRSQSSVAKISLVRQGPTIPDPTIKPGETPQQAAARIKRHIAGLGQASPHARPLDESRDTGFSEKSEQHYAELKARMLGSKPAKVREVTHHAETAGATTLAESTSVQDRALSLMRSLGQSTSPRATGFSENYKAALKELEGVK